MEVSKLTDRWNYIDLIEFWGMLFVLMYHSTTYSYSWMGNGSSLLFLRYFLRTILSTGVPLFFFANGYLSLNRDFHLKKHIIKTVKIIILTFVWGIFNLLFLMLIKNEYLSLKEFAVYLWTWRLGWINHFWYMGALVCVYVFFPLLKVTFDHNQKIFFYFTVICAILTFGNVFINHNSSIILNALGLHEGIVNTNWFNIFNPFRGFYGYSFVYFCVGGLAHNLVKKIKEISIKKRNATATIIIILSCTGLFITGIALSNISGDMWDVVWSGYDTIFTLINVCMIFVLCLSYSGHNKIIKLISTNTLGIYFIHEIFIHLAGKFVNTIPGVQSFIGNVIYSLVIMSVCLSLTQLFIRIPGIKKLIKL